MSPRKVPLRQCVGCQEQKPKRSMLRIVLTPTGDIVVDKTGKRAGRGTYICASPECFEMAKKRRSLDRGLKTAVPQEVYDVLRNVLEESEVYE